MKVILQMVIGNDEKGVSFQEPVKKYFMSELEKVVFSVDTFENELERSPLVYCFLVVEIEGKPVVLMYNDCFTAFENVFLWKSDDVESILPGIHYREVPFSETGLPDEYDQIWPIGD